jgi:hypothetical protein
MWVKGFLQGFAPPSIADNFGLRRRCLSEASLADAKIIEKHRDPEGQASTLKKALHPHQKRR